MAKKKPTKGVKKDKPLSISGSFEDVIKVSVSGNPAPKPKAKKKK
jgi:hypothetical protein